MFLPFKKLNNESGIVLFIVLMTAIIIMIFSVSILTQSVNEVNYAQQQIDQISSDQLAKGMFWNAYSNGMSGPGGQTSNGTGRSYNMSMSQPVHDNNLASNQYEINVTYENPS